MVAVLSGFFHGKAQAGESKGPRFCVIVPHERNRPEVEPVRHLAGAEPMNAAPSEGRIASFFKGQMKKVGVGMPDCFRIEAEQAALEATAAHGDEPAAGALAVSTASSVFPSAGYFSRISRDGRRAFAFGAGVGHTGSASEGDDGSPDARVGIVFGLNF
jgi:hypothetical protein